MNSNDRHELLARYADGELEAPERNALESELAGSAEERAVVERWQALRRCAKRAVAGDALPAGLAGRVREAVTADRAFSNSRVYRLVSVFAAAAAVLLLAVFYSSRGSIGPGTAVAGMTIDAERFAQIYSHCAKEHHESVALNKYCPVAAQELMDETCRDYRVLVPNLTQQGWDLYGICKCFPKNGPVAGMHVYYRSRDPQPRYLSFFSANRCIDIAGCGKQVCCETQRTYQSAAAAGVNVVKWSEQGGCFVLAGEIKVDELEKLAAGVNVGPRTCATPK